MFLKKLVGLFRRSKQNRQPKVQEQEKVKVFVVDTNISIHCVRFGELEFLNGLKGGYVPWAVIKELMTVARIAEEDKQELKGSVLRREAWRKSLQKQGWVRDQILARESRCPYAQEACSFVQKKVNNADWKTIGTSVEIKKFVDGFSEELKQKVSRADLEVLASCFILAEADYQVVLITRDRRLREIVESFGIETRKGISADC